MERIVKSHDRTQPLFLYMAFQNVHSPVQAPQKYVDKYKFIKDDVRRTYAGMVDILDEAVGNLTRIFQEHGYSLIPTVRNWPSQTFELEHIFSIVCVSGYGMTR